MVRYSFAGKVVLVTGSSRGMGAAIVEAFAGAGATCVVNYFNDPSGQNRRDAEQTADRIRRHQAPVHLLEADVSRYEAVEALMKIVRPAPPASLVLLMIVCVFPELFTIPAPSIVSVFRFVSIVNEFAPESKLMPAAMMSLPSVAVPPFEPRKRALLPSTQLAPTNEVGEELHEKNPVGSGVSQVPLPAAAGLAAVPVQNRS